MKLPFTLPWQRKQHEAPKDPYPIVFEWQGDGRPFTPYARIRRINPGYHDWDRLVSRRAGLLSLRDGHFLLKPKHKWEREDIDLAIVWGELLQLPTHVLELGFRRDQRRHRFFREGFNFGLLQFFDGDYVAREVGKFVVTMFERLDSPKRQNPGTLIDLRDEWHQVYTLANILAAYKHIRSF